LKTLGIEKGRPFSPSAGTKATLEEGIREAQAWMEAKYDAGLPPYWDDSRWTYVGYPDQFPVSRTRARDGFVGENFLCKRSTVVDEAG
jgi:hypothetical protein